MIHLICTITLKKTKVSIIYTPGELIPVKIKIRQYDMELSDSSLLKKKGTEYSITHYK